MVHDRDDKYDSQEDGEYHFSDDQANYDAEPESVKASTPDDNKPSGGSLTSKLNQYRKPIIGVVVFVLLVFLVYKISAPTVTTTPAADFAQNAGIIPTQKPTIKQLPKPMKVTETITPAPIESPSMAMTNPPAIAPMPESVTAPPATTTTTTTTTPAAEQQPTVVTTTTAQTQPNPAVVVVPDNTSPMDKVVALEEENAKLTSEYTQKLAESEAQNVAVQGKLQDLNMRLASIENTLSHLGRTMQEARAPAPTPTVMSRPQEPSHIGYSVQAIIPGRAWLKSDNGETVTVAEGDTLKSYGRIVKIDPYDGVVQIDTGGKIISLSYGVSTE